MMLSDPPRPDDDEPHEPEPAPKPEPEPEAPPAKVARRRMLRAMRPAHGRSGYQTR